MLTTKRLVERDAPASPKSNPDRRTFVHVRQPNDHTCAPAVVAIVTGAPLEELIAELRPTPKSGTRHARMIRALRDRGVRCGDRFVSSRGTPLPEVAIVRITFPDGPGHVVVKQGLWWFDPLLADPFHGRPPGLGVRWSNGGRVTSSLWLGDGMP